MLTFANLAGFWALLGIPAVVLIHFLQRQSQRITSSTLFLLEALDRQNVQGQKFDRLRHSIPLWLQLLAVLLLTWVLVQPRWLMENSVQKIALILDSSASMRAFKENLVTTLSREIPRLSRGARTLELTLLESHLDDRPLYNGTSVLDMVAALETWAPHRSAHDPGPALRVGRSLAGPRGIVLFVTDHPVGQLGYEAKVLSLGEAIDNVGFAGVSANRESDPPSWEAVVKNYSSKVQEREWFLQFGQQRTEVRQIELQPGEIRTLQGRFPQGAEAITLRLKRDRFDQDDDAPIVLPQAKVLAIAKVSVPALDELMTGVIDSFENGVQPTETTGVDLVLTTYNPLAPTQPEPVSLVFLHQVQPGRQFLTGPIAAARHPLMENLNWQGLIARSSPGMPVLADDTVLLWQGERPLVFLRRDANLRQLIFNFDIPSSNVAQLPSFIVLANRFVEGIRSDKVAPSAANLELHQQISLAYEQGNEAAEVVMSSGEVRTTAPLNRVRSLRAPDSPGFFEVTQGERLLLSGAAHFADTREADFSKAAPLNELASLTTEVVTEHSRRDDGWQIWIVLLLVAVLLSWYFIHQRTPGVEGNEKGAAVT